jgi:hypothetical protein
MAAMLNKAQSLLNCLKVTSGGATVTQNFLVVCTETKHDTFNHNPSTIVAMEKKAFTCFPHSLKRVLYNAEHIF